MEVSRQDKLVSLYPLNHGQCLRLKWAVVWFKEVRKVPIKIVAVVVRSEEKGNLKSQFKLCKNLVNVVPLSKEYLVIHKLSLGYTRNGFPTLSQPLYIFAWIVQTHLGS